MIEETLMPAQPIYKNSVLSWIVCLSAALFFLYEDIQMMLFNAIDPELVRSFSLTAGELGLFSAVYLFANLCFLPFAGLILDRISTRKVISIAMIVCVIGTALLAVSHNFWQALIFRFATGIGSAFAFLSCMRLASRWFPPERMALAAGIMVAMAFTGGIIAQTPFTLLTMAVGWRHALLVDAALGALFYIIVVTFVRDNPSYLEDEHRGHKEHLQDLGYWKSMKLSYLNPQNWLAGIFAALLSLPIFLLGATWGEPYLTQAHHLGREAASEVISWLFIGSIVGPPVIGWFSDRLKLRKPPMILSCLISLLLALVMIFVPALSAFDLGLLFLLLGFINSAQALAYPTVTELNTQALTATSLSVVSITMIGIGTLMQPAFGFVIDYYWKGQMTDGAPIYSAHAYQVAMMIIPVGFVLALIAARLLKETYCKRV